jgi:hypothetical protein
VSAGDGMAGESVGVTLLFCFDWARKEKSDTLRRLIGRSIDTLDNGGPTGCMSALKRSNLGLM